MKGSIRARLARVPSPAGERTARVLAGYRRTAGDRGRGQARPFGAADLAAVLATCHRLVLTFERCAAYAADQDAGSTVYGWAESYDSASGARQRALAECGTRGSGCTVRVWGCTGPVVEEGLGLDRAARRRGRLAWTHQPLCRSRRDVLNGSRAGMARPAAAVQ